MVVRVEAQMVTVVPSALVRVAEDGVGFADAHEARGCVRVGRVVVRVVAFGEDVEGSRWASMLRWEAQRRVLGLGGCGGVMAHFLISDGEAFNGTFNVS